MRLILGLLFFLGAHLVTWFQLQHFEGVIWPARFIGFGVGILVYALFVGIFFKEGITLKTLTSLLLSLSLIFIQVFWK